MPGKLLFLKGAGYCFFVTILILCGGCIDDFVRDYWIEGRFYYSVFLPSFSWSFIFFICSSTKSGFCLITVEYAEKGLINISCCLILLMISFLYLALFSLISSAFSPIPRSPPKRSCVLSFIASSTWSSSLLLESFSLINETILCLSSASLSPFAVFIKTSG